MIRVGDRKKAGQALPDMQGRNSFFPANVATPSTIPTGFRPLGAMEFNDAESSITVQEVGRAIPTSKEHYAAVVDGVSNAMIDNTM